MLCSWPTKVTARKPPKIGPKMPPIRPKAAV